MRVTYITHSCFLAESETSLFLFDYFEGKLPQLNNDKPLYCFASHSHGDHFSEKLFDVTAAHPNVHYILSDDIFKSRIPTELHTVTDFVSPHQGIAIDNIHIKTLKSTDLGVAFIIEENGRLIYHAGDLNDWQWEGESDKYNADMEANYISEIKSLADMHFFAAFLPLDARQNKYMRQRGIRLFLEYTAADNIFPMHLWGKYELADELASELGLRKKAMFKNAHHKGDVFDIL